jgi:hypothetical protein
MFPKPRRLTIGTRDGATFYQLSSAPNCSYEPSLSFERPHHSIGARFSEPHPRQIPGPGQYSPAFVLPRTPAFSLSGPKYRDEWLIDTKGSPSPDRYDPRKPLRVMPPYSIGEKSREGPSKLEARKVIAIGSFFVQLDDTITVEEARAYAKSHPDLTDVLRDIFEFVIYMKPVDPLGKLRGRFERLKRERLGENADDNPLTRLLAEFAKER